MCLVLGKQMFSKKNESLKNFRKIFISTSRRKKFIIFFSLSIYGDNRFIYLLFQVEKRNKKSMEFILNYFELFFIFFYKNLRKEEKER